jgi:hypothetical protein
MESRGRPAPYVDGQIAAIAQTYGLVLVTLNTRDFGQFTDLRVVIGRSKDALRSQESRNLKRACS